MVGVKIQGVLDGEQQLVSVVIGKAEPVACVFVLVIGDYTVSQAAGLPYLSLIHI